MNCAPIAFISSTTKDLREYRDEVQKAALKHGFFPLMMEDFPASGRSPTLDDCLQKVRRAELVICIVGHRYGWVPNDTGQPDAKSITWLECDEAVYGGKEILAFIADPECNWPAEQREQYRLVSERESTNIAREVKRNEENLRIFKDELRKHIYCVFDSPAQLRSLVGEALSEWHRRHPYGAEAEAESILIEYLTEHPSEGTHSIKGLDALSRVFELGAYPSLAFKSRLIIANYVGQIGDPRFRHENWSDIKPGNFFMGASANSSAPHNYDPQAESDEWVVRNVTLDEFELGRYPVTVQEYDAFIVNGGYTTREYWDDPKYFGLFSRPKDWDKQRSHRNHPVVGVSWYEAAAYCAYKNGRPATEAEWERAARGRGNTKYPWGNEEPLDDWYMNWQDRVGSSTPVGLYSKGRNPEGGGVFDLLGNVWEWCQDWYSVEYEPRDYENPTGPEFGQLKVVRGGSWRSHPGTWRASSRFKGTPATQYPDVGFRCRRGINAKEA